MNKIKLFLCVAMFGAMSFGAFSAYEHLTMSEEERFLLANIEALTQDEGRVTSEFYPCYISACNGQCTTSKGLTYRGITVDLCKCETCNSFYNR